MKQWLLVFLCAAGFSAFAAIPRKVEISGKTEKVSKLEIVTDNPAPVVQFAATEMQTFLKQATGIKFPIVSKVSGKHLALIIGDGPSARAAGLDVKKLPEEGFYIVRKGKKVFLAGVDDVRKHPALNNWQQTYRRSSLTAVYDFLERFAGIRFYFPGPGTVVPEKDALYLPEKINILERPDMPSRSYYIGRTTGYPGYPTGKGAPTGENLNRIRLRTSEWIPVYGHGLNYLNLINRFSKTHPEYFALMPNGKRYSDPKMPQPGQLCFNNGLREVIYQDAKAYFTGKPASSRGIKNWHYNLARGRSFNVSTQDWFYWCGCEKCSKIAEGGRGKIYSDPVHRRAVSNFMWEFTSEIAARLEKENIDGYITQHVYPPMDIVPDKKIHHKVMIEACVTAKGGDARDTALLRSWAEKSGLKLDVWTYAIGKHMRKQIPGIPPMYPRNIVRFLDDNRNYIKGAFYEAESDTFISQYLNFYVLIRKEWNNSLSADDLIDEHCQVMFGKGAPMMKKFYDALEDAWGNKILGNTIDTGLGPTSVIPSDYQIWTQIYSAERIREFNSWFDAALAAAKGDKGASDRIQFIRKYLLGPLETEAAKFHSAQTALDSWIIPCPGSVWLRSTKGERNEVATKISVKRTADALIFTADCEEPRMADLIARHTGHDNPKTYEDSGVEIFLNPSGDRKVYYQFVVNTNGALTDYRCEKGGQTDISWNSSASARASKRADGWSMTLTVPLKDLGKYQQDAFPVNFARGRRLKGKKTAVSSYQWSPVSDRRGGFHAIDNWGKLALKPIEKTLFKTDFNLKKLPYCWCSGGAKGGQKAAFDDKIFISGGRSLRLTNVKGKRMGMTFRIPEMKPNTQYRLAFYLRTALNGKGGASVGVNFAKRSTIRVPRLPEGGTSTWHRMTADFTAPPETGRDYVPYITFGIFYAEGDAWFDFVELTELKK